MDLIFNSAPARLQVDTLLDHEPHYQPISRWPYFGN